MVAAVADLEIHMTVNEIDVAITVQIRRPDVVESRLKTAITASTTVDSSAAVSPQPDKKA